MGIISTWGHSEQESRKFIMYCPHCNGYMVSETLRDHGVTTTSLKCLMCGRYLHVAVQTVSIREDPRKAPPAPEFMRTHVCKICGKDYMSVRKVKTENCSPRCKDRARYQRKLTCTSTNKGGLNDRSTTYPG